jgi:ribosomal-protein-alanine N-acetyltransferase
MNAILETVPVHIRWTIGRDLPETLAIEEAARQWDAWSDDEFCRRLRERNCVGMVAERCPGDGAILGFMLYRLYAGHICLDNLAVHPDHRRRGVGTEMVRKLLGKLSAGRRTFLRVDVPEEDVGAQLFFRALGLPAVGVEGDCVRMEWHVEE